MIRKTGLVLAALLFWEGAAFSQEPVARIVAVVNDEVITEQELQDAVLEATGKKAEEPSVRESALDRLIEHKLILQKAAGLGISVTPEEVRKEIQKVRESFPSEEAFQQALEDARLTYEAFEKRYGEQLLIRKMVGREVQSKIRVSPGEIETFYQENLTFFQGPKLWRIAHILIRREKPGEADPEAKARAEEIYKRLEAGEPFSELARQYSEGPRKEEGGDLGYIEPDKLMPEITEVLRDLPIGSASKMVESPIGYNFFQILERKQNYSIPFKEVKKEIEARLYEEKTRAGYAEWVSKLKQNAYIKK